MSDKEDVTALLVRGVQEKTLLRVAELIDQVDLADDVDGTVDECFLKVWEYMFKAVNLIGHVRPTTGPIATPCDGSQSDENVLTSPRGVVE